MKWIKVWKERKNSFNLNRQCKKYKNYNKIIKKSFHY